MQLLLPTLSDDVTCNHISVLVCKQNI